MTRFSPIRCATCLIVAGALLPIGGLAAGTTAPREQTAAAIRLAQHEQPGGGAAEAVEKPAARPAPPAGPPKNLEALPPGRYTGVLGKKVAGPDGKDLGLIVDVVVDVDGTPRAAIIDFGGFLGVGSRKIAVDWRLLNFAPDRADGQIWLSLGRAEIAAAPEYRPGDASDAMVGPLWALPSPASGR